MPILDSQMPDLMRMIAGTAEAIGAQLTPTAAAVIAGDLRQYDMQTIGVALSEVRRSARGRFSVADVIRIIAEKDGRPAPDEAWSIAMAAMDESATLAITSEIQIAMGIAQPVADSGDMIGTRRSFLVAYERLVGEARAAAKPCSWTISLGTDQAGRKLAIEDAARLGRISQESASKHLAQIGHDSKLTPDGQAIAGLITGKSPRGKIREEVREKLAQLRVSLTGHSEADKAKQREIERRERAELNAMADTALGIGDGAPKPEDW